MDHSLRCSLTFLIALRTICDCINFHDLQLYKLLRCDEVENATGSNRFWMVARRVLSQSSEAKVKKDVENGSIVSNEVS